jgi:hypothetical protein
MPDLETTDEIVQGLVNQLCLKWIFFKIHFSIII